MKRLPVSVMVVVLRRRQQGVEVLLLRRARARNGFWQPVTGSLLPGETPRDAAVREVREETGIERFELLHDLHFTHQFDIVPHRLNEYDAGVTVNTEHCFAMRVAPTAHVQLSDEHEAFDWCTFERAARRLAYEANRAALRAVREACGRGEL